MGHGTQTVMTALSGPLACVREQQLTTRTLGVAGHMLMRGLGTQQHGSQLPIQPPSSLLQPLSLASERKESEQRDANATTLLLRTLGQQHALLGSSTYYGYHRQAWPLAVRHTVLLPGDISGRRHISFFRFLSGGSALSKSRLVPDAADADAALRDYQELKARLDKLERPSSVKSTTQVLKDATFAIGRGLLAIWTFLLSIPRRVAAWQAMTPEDWAKWRKETWATIKHEAHHYWVGTKLLGYEIRIASRHAFKAAQGKTLSRRERMQLTRTTADLFRLVPMIIIIVVPLLEFALPLLLRIFPNMLPSTFEDKLKKEEELKRRLAVRLELARFLQDTVAEMAKDIARRKGSSTDAEELNSFIEKVRAGQEVDNAEIIKFARLFNDELTLDHLERVQLVTMCQFVGISPFGTDAFLRSRLRQHLVEIKQDDYEIEQEGLENMTEEELRVACRARGMRAVYGEGAVKYMERQMRDWLDLSLHRGLPSSLLLLSRAFTITAQERRADVSAAKDQKYEKLKETLSVIPGQVVESVAIEQLGSSKSGVEALQQRLEFLQREEEAIKAELQRAEEASKAAAAQEAAMRSAIKAGDLPAAVTPAATTAAAPVFTPGIVPKKTPEELAAAAAAAATAAAQPAAAAPAAATPAAPPSPAAVLVAPEEAAAAAAEARQKKVKAIISSLMDMATRSGVAKERAVFMGLMRKEIDRVNTVLADSGGKGSSTGRILFGSQGLTVAKDKVLDEEATGTADQAEQEAKDPISRRLSDRVSRMLTSIEAELDRVETKIGGKLHMLDTDDDGQVSTAELENALKYLREQLSPGELSEVLSQLKAKAKDNGDTFADAVTASTAAPGAGQAPKAEGGGEPELPKLITLKEGGESERSETAGASKTQATATAAAH